MRPIHKTEYYSILKKENSALHNNMFEPWEHYAKWNKSVTEKQVLCDSKNQRVDDGC